MINGQKLWTSAAHKSNWLFGMFRTDPDAPKHRGISFLVMDMTTPGISVRHITSMGWVHATNETFYEDVHVPADQLIGEENRGWYVGVTLLDFERSNIAGAIEIRKNIDRLLEDVRTDEGQRMTEGGGLRRQRTAIADHYVESEVMFNYSFRIISMQARGIIPNYEASTSKMFASELVQRLSRTGIKVYGLYSNVWDPDSDFSPSKSLFTQSNVHSVVGTIAGGSSGDSAQHHRHARARPAARSRDAPRGSLASRLPRGDSRRAGAAASDTSNCAWAGSPALRTRDIHTRRKRQRKDVHANRKRTSRFLPHAGEPGALGAPRQGRCVRHRPLPHRPPLGRPGRHQHR